MTPQEEQMIDGLIDRIRSTQVTDKDVAAEQHLQQGLAGYPDAVYVLAQTVLVQQYGLQQAQGQIRDLQAQVANLQQHAAQPAGGSFLSHLFGGSGSSQPVGGPASMPQYQPVNNPGYGAYPQPPAPYAQPMAYGQPTGGGFLQGALQTAAGVAAGEMAFAGLESLFHGFGGGGGYGSGFGGRPEEVVNNYYEDGDRGGHEGHESRDEAGLDGFSDDAGSRDSGPQADSTYADDFGAVDNGNDDTDFTDSDNSGGDDGSSY